MASGGGGSGTVIPGTIPSSIFENSIITSQISGQNADFLSVAGLNVTLIANATDPFEYNISGTVNTLRANAVFAVPDNANSFLLIDVAGAISRSANPITYAFSAPGAPATGDYWFDLGHNQMKTWNGAAWVNSNKIGIGYVRADGGTINARYACLPIGAYPMWIHEYFGDGSDGFLDVSAGTTTIDGKKQYTAIVVRGSGKITTDEQGMPNASSPPWLVAQNLIIALGTSGIDVSGLGDLGTLGTTGNGDGGDFHGVLGGAAGGGGGSSFATGGAGNMNTTIYQLGIGAFNGGAGGTAGPGNGGPGANVSSLASVWFGESPPLVTGAGGGAGGSDGGINGGNGGNGGGFVFLAAPAVAIGPSATVNANGAAGQHGPGAGQGGGGGGGGGGAFIFTRNFMNSGSFTASGGPGGTSGGAFSGAGGPGGAGVAATRIV